MLPAPAVATSPKLTSTATVKLWKIISHSDSWIAGGLALAIVARKTVLLRRRSTDAYATIDEYAALEIALVGLACLFLVSRTYVPRLLSGVRKTSLHWLLGFYTFCIISAAWSKNPAYTLFQAAEVASQTLLILILLTKCRSFLDAENRVLQVSAATIVMGLCLPLKWHGFSLDLERWHTNTYTVCGAILFCYTFTESLRASGQRADRLRKYAFFAGAALLLGTSGASYISVLAGVAIAALMIGGKRWPLVLLLSFLSVAAYFNPDAATELLFPNKTDVQIETLHGRTYLWTRLFEFFTESPWTGHGFAMGAKLGGINQTNTHNSFFSVILGTGIVGLLLVLIGCVMLLREFARNHARRLPGTAGCVCALTAGLTNSMSIGFLGEAWREMTLVFTAFLILHVLNLRGAKARALGERTIRLSERAD